MSSVKHDQRRGVPDKRHAIFEPEKLRRKFVQRPLRRFRGFARPPAGNSQSLVGKAGKG